MTRNGYEIKNIMDGDQERYRYKSNDPKKIKNSVLFESNKKSRLENVERKIILTVL